MNHLMKKVVALLAAFFVLQSVAPASPPQKLAAVAGETVNKIIVTYQKGDGKGEASETDDGTLSSRFVEGTQSRSLEYQGEGNDNSLLLKRVVETSGGDTTNETKRIVIKFPNIIGDGKDKIPVGTEISSATLKLVINSFSSPTATLSANVYFMLENWTEAEPGYLKSPSWRSRHPAATESDTKNQWTNFGADTPTSASSTPITEAVQIPSIINTTISFDVTEAVAAWADGKPNNGVMLKFFAENPGGTLRLASFYSSEWTNKDLRPKLEVTHVEPAPEPVPPPSPAPEPELTPVPIPPVEPPPTPQAEPPVTPAPAPAPAPTPPPPAPTSKPEPSPAPIPAPAPPSYEAPKGEPETPIAPLPAQEPEPPAEPNIIIRFFQVIQRSILETWARIIELLR